MTKIGEKAAQDFHRAVSKVFDRVKSVWSANIRKLAKDHKVYGFAATKTHNTMLQVQWRPFTQIYSTGVARVPTVVSGALYYRLDVCKLCKLLFQTQFLYLIIQQ